MSPMQNRLMVPQRTPLLLDLAPGAAAAYSLRQLSKSYTGPVVTVRRSTDSAEANFTANEIDNGDLASWCMGGDGLVKQWWDQSGHARHASQATTASQPKIVSAGVVILEGGKPAVQFDGTDDGLATTSFSMGAAFSVFAVLMHTAFVANAYYTPIAFNFVAAGSSYLTAGRWLLTKTGATALDWQQSCAALLGKGSSSGRAPRAISSSPVFSANTQQIVSGILSSTTSKMYSNGAAVALSVQLASAIAQETGILWLGQADGLDKFPGKIQEAIVYDTDQTALRALIEGSMAWYF